METLVLSSDDIRRIVNGVGLDSLMDEVIDVLESTFREFDPNRTLATPRQGFQYEDPCPGLLEWMPAFEVGQRVTIKLVGYHPTNPGLRGLPTILSTLCVFETDSGHLAAVMDGTLLTALRTGAASAVASRILARTESKTLGLIGCGAQAVSQLHALSRVLPLEEVLFYDVDSAALESFVDRVSFVRGGSLRLALASPGRIVHSSDVICTATSVGIGEGPVFEDEGCRPWLHVNAVGSDMPGKTELPRSLLARSLVCPDFREQAMSEGECQRLNESEIGPDLVEIVKRPDAFARARKETTVFDSTGWAIEDHVSLGVILAHAVAANLGTRVQIEGVSHDPRDPYDFLNRTVAPGVLPEISG